MGWEDGFFLIQIANKDGLVNTTKPLKQLEKSFEKIDTDNNGFNEDEKFDVHNIIDARRKQERATVIRQGQTELI